MNVSGTITPALSNATTGRPFIPDFYEPYQSIVRTAYVILTMINIGGNGLMSYVIMKKKILHTPQNYLLLNLSLADVVGAIGIYPYVFVNEYPRSESDLEQSILCAVIRGQLIYFVSVGTSLSNLCAISWNRYFAIRYPLKTKFHLSKSGAIKLAVIVWTCILVLSLPFWAYYTFSEAENVCVGKPDSLMYRIYGTFILVFGFILPVAFLILSLVALQLVTKNNTTGLHERSFRRRTQKIEKAEKVVKFLIVNLIASWCPFLVYWSLKSFTSYFPPGDAGQLPRRKWARITLLFSIMNGTLDPILFYIGSSKIRNQTVLVIRRCWKRAEAYASGSSKYDESQGTMSFRSSRLSYTRGKSTRSNFELSLRQHKNLAYTSSVQSQSVFTIDTICEDEKKSKGRGSTQALTPETSNTTVM